MASTFKHKAQYKITGRLRALTLMYGVAAPCYQTKRCHNSMQKNLSNYTWHEIRIEPEIIETLASYPFLCDLFGVVLCYIVTI